MSDHEDTDEFDTRKPKTFLQRYGTIIIIVVIVIIISVIMFFLFRVAVEYERVVISRLGRIREPARGPGLFFAIPYIDICTYVDMRTVSIDIPPQEILTRDSVTVAVDGVLFYSISNALKCFTAVGNFRESALLLAATTLRNVLGTRDLGQLLSDREAINHTIQANLEELTDAWGVKVERVEIKDIRLPSQLRKAMAAEAEAARVARAKVIAAKGEVKAASALKEASLIMIENPVSVQLRYLQSINTISTEQNSTIVFPFPTDLIRSFLGK